MFLEPEYLVPPLELCQRIPDGSFADSLLVYRVFTDGSYGVTDRNWITRWNRPDGELLWQESPSAPTTMEIMAKLPLGTIIQQDTPGVWVCIVHGGEAGVMVEKSGNPATAAMMIWMKIMNQEVDHE